MDQNQYFPEGTGELGNPSSDETIRAKVHQLIERFAPAMPEMKPQRVAVILGNHMDHSMLMRLLEKSAEHSITLTDVVVDPMGSRRPSKDVGLHEALMDLLHQMQIEEACVCTESPALLERLPDVKVVFSPMASKFNKFQENQRSKRPPVKRQFAQIRPPRRGGR